MTMNACRKCQGNATHALKGTSIAVLCCLHDCKCTVLAYEY